MKIIRINGVVTYSAAGPGGHEVHVQPNSNWRAKELQPIKMFVSGEDMSHFTNGLEVEMVIKPKDAVMAHRKMKKDEAEGLANQVVSDCNGGMRVVIGDRTPAQYDKADRMAGYIKAGVLRALHRLGYTPEDYS